MLESGKMKELEEIRKISGIKVHYVRQPYMRGLGDAILCAKEFVDDVVYNGDGEPALHQLIRQYEKTGTTIVGCQMVAEEQVSSYGIIDGKPEMDPDLMKVSDMIEKPSVAKAPSRFAALGRYVITPDIFSILEETKPGKGGEIQLTDALRVLARNGKVYAYNFKGQRYDTGNKLGYLKAVVEFALRREDLGDDFRAYLKEIVGAM